MKLIKLQLKLRKLLIILIHLWKYFINKLRIEFCDKIEKSNKNEIPKFFAPIIITSSSYQPPGANYVIETSHLNYTKTIPVQYYPQQNMPMPYTREPWRVKR
ncbi:hypothetical protein PVAND_002088 [Polypedilum vanderplanki]|uniref:Uncharacterized protein n=1 Tax=Polypedilum vanderplanki TaxID=319348 RepID=A0A9J6BQC5_POLVA|nr:hypothetical protein PVAND_002088 [Polypedilum vanderplanki]